MLAKEELEKAKNEKILQINQTTIEGLLNAMKEFYENLNYEIENVTISNVVVLIDVNSVYAEVELTTNLAEWTEQFQKMLEVFCDETKAVQERKESFKANKIKLIRFETLESLKEMIDVEGGVLTLGDERKTYNKPHKVKFSSFKIAKYEVTQALYESVMGKNPSYFKGKLRPVESVSWSDAIYFCNLLSEKEGLTPVYSINKVTDVKKWSYTPHKGNEIRDEIKQDAFANGYRLPTENEWKIAARSGKSYEYSGSNKINKVAWYDQNSNETTHPVGQKKPNNYGLYDMSGNVCEWCWNLYNSGYGYCVLRGGSWSSDCSFCIVSDCKSYDSYNCSFDNGFRLVRSSSN